MGYESRVIIARKNTMFKGFVEVIAELNLCGVDDGLLQLFDRDFKGHFYDFYGCDDEVKEDKYGKPLTYTTFNRAYKYCLNSVQEQNYRRLKLLLAVLNEVRTGWADEYNDFIIIHYGY